MHNKNLRHWGKFGAADSIYNGIQTMYHFQKTFFTDVLSLEIPDQYDDGMFTCSGINCKGVPLNIIFSTTGGGDTSYFQYIDVSAVANITAANKRGFSAHNLYLDNAQASTYTPIIIANFTSKLVLSKWRNCEYYN